VKDWAAWHAGYDDPSSPLAARLERVRARLRQAISDAPPGPVRLISLCAGQGRDVFGVLPGHPRRRDVHAVLVESDEHLVAAAGEQAAAAGLRQAEVRQADASQVANFADLLPAGILLLCGIFGNISDSDIRRTVQAAPALCAPGATVIWTRHRRPPDLTPSIRSWFASGGFDEVGFDEIPSSTMAGVGAARLGRAPSVPLPDQPLFTFRRS
jgi:hypothetical protein